MERTAGGVWRMNRVPVYLVRLVHSNPHSHSHSNLDSDSHTHSHSHAPRIPDPPPVDTHRHSKATLDFAQSSKQAVSKPAARLTIGRARDYSSSLLASSLTAANLISPFVPLTARDAQIALNAFAVTLQRAAHPPHTSSSNISVASGASSATARLRLQFWKQTLQDIFAGKVPPSEPVAVLLAEVIKQRAYTRSFFTRMVDARMARVGDPPFASISSLADYGEAAYSSMLYLLGESMPSAHSTEAEHVCSHIGRAIGVVDILTDFPAAVERRRRVLLPLDIMIKYDLREEDLLRRLDRQDAELNKRLQDAIFEVATHANDQLITARSMFEETVTKIGGRKSIDDAMFAPMLSAVATKTWLEQLEKVDFNLYSPKLKLKKWSLPWKMYLAYKSRRI
ncbi:Squalene/phytoene synthase-domain-containing protein [Lipomyces arxii]|uniref:Squalene/phytoene synthase-domain-containing protein n=1 Tax=Lipomyces arxii TaxID=56418 RepID=UPI0034CDCE92